MHREDEAWKKVQEAPEQEEILDQSEVGLRRVAPHGEAGNYSGLPSCHEEGPCRSVNL